MDASKPTDVELVSALPAYIREIKSFLTALVTGGGGGGVTSITSPAGTTSLSVGTELGMNGYEVILMKANVPINLISIIGGTQGQVKVFIFLDNNVSVVDGQALNGNFYLNQLPLYTSFNTQAGDVLTVVNIGGNGSGIQGYWREISRQVSLK